MQQVGFSNLYHKHTHWAPFPLVHMLTEAVRLVADCLYLKGQSDLPQDFHGGVPGIQLRIWCLPGRCFITTELFPAPSLRVDLHSVGSPSLSLMLRFEPRTSYMLGKHCTSELHCQPFPILF